MPTVVRCSRLSPAVLALFVAATGWAVPEAAPDVGALVRAMSEPALRTSVGELVAFGSRAVGQPGNDQAAAYLHKRLSAITGLRVAPLAAPWNNVIATLPASDPASVETYIVGAHYDSIAQPPTAAPGATDNAAGVAVVLELARILAAHRFRHTLVFACFNAEERGCAGSRAFVRELVNDRRLPALYLNYDSTAFDPEGKLVLDVMSHEPAAAAKRLLFACNERYALGFTLVENKHTCASDHTPFREAGCAAIATHQEVHGAHYHTARDTIDRVSFPYVLRNGQLGLAVLATLAGPVGR